MDIGTLTGGITLEDQISSRLSLISTRVWQFVDNYGGAMATAAFGTATLVSAIGGAIASIGVLGSKGSTILGVEDAFNRLAAAAGSTGEAFIGALSGGVRDTVDSMVLMQSTNRLLSSGLKVTEGDLSLMAKTAREMGKATGTDATSGLNVLSDAMLTGNARMLKRYGIQLDLDKAEKQFRASLGGTTAALTAAGKLEVNRLAVLEGMRVKLDTLGESELTFKERIQQIQVGLGNWIDSLAKAVAVSPNVLRAFDAISDAIREAFGNTSQTMLNMVIGWINRFADMAGRYGPAIIRTLVTIKDRIVTIWEAVVAAWDLVPDWFKNIAKDASLAAAALYITNRALGTVAGGDDLLTVFAGFATITSGLKDFGTIATTVVPKAIGQVKTLIVTLALSYQLGGVAAIWSGITAAFVGFASSMGGITILVTALAAALIQVGKAVASFGENWKAGGGTLWGFLTLKDDDTFIRRWLGLSSAIEETVKKGKDVFLPTEIITSEAAPAGPVSAPLFKDDIVERAKAMSKTWNDASMNARVFTQAFNSLSAAQRENYEIQRLLVPEIEKLVTTHQEVTPEMLHVVDAARDAKLTFLDWNRAVLESSNLTLGQIGRLKELGMSEADIASQYRVSTESLNLYVASLQKAATIEQNLASFNFELVKQQERAAERRRTLELTANEAVSNSYRQLNDLINRETMTTTDYQILKIKEEEAERIAALDRTGAAVAGFIEAEKTLSARRIASLKIDNESLRDFSQASLQSVADKAAATYAFALAHSERYSKGAIKHFRDLAKEAQNAADGVKSTWDRTYSALGNVSTILDSIPGKFAEIGAMAARAGQAIMNNLAEGDWVGALVSAGTAVVGIFSKLFGGLTDYQKRVRAAAAEMKTLTAEAIKNAGSLEILRLRAHLAGIQIDEAFKSKSPEFLSDVLKDLESKAGVVNERLNDMIRTAALGGEQIPAAYRPLIEALVRTGDLTQGNINLLLGLPEAGVPSVDEVRAAAERYGLTLEGLGHKVQQLKITEIAEQVVADYDIMSRAGADMTVVAKGMAEQVQFLVTQALEFGHALPEGMRPILEHMLELGLLTDQSGVKLEDLSGIKFEKPLEASIDALILKLDELIEKISEGVGGALAGIGNMRVSPQIDVPNIEEPSYMARGGRVLAWRPRGTDTVPAMLTPGETVTPAGQGGLVGTVEVPLEVDGEEFARAIVKVAKGL